MSGALGRVEISDPADELGVDGSLERSLARRRLLEESPGQTAASASERRVHERGVSAESPSVFVISMIERERDDAETQLFPRISRRRLRRGQRDAI